MHRNNNQQYHHLPIRGAVFCFAIFFFNIVQNAFDRPRPPPPFENLVENLKLLRGPLLSYYEFCSSFSTWI